MTRIIPRELIKHLEWTPGQEAPQRTPVNPAPSRTASQQSLLYSIDDILNGQTFYDDSLPIALQQALDYAGSDGIVATVPELIAAKVKADSSHDLWQRWYSPHTEENIGIDKEGKFYGRNDPVLVVVNGGGILTPDRIKQAYEEGLTSGSAKYLDDEFAALLEGRLPNGESLELYRIEEIKDGVSNLPHRFGVVMPYAIAQNTTSGYLGKSDFMNNPLVIARAGGLEHLDAYFKKAKDTSDDTLGNHHPFSGRDASTPQGRVLFLGNYSAGLVGDDTLDLYVGRCVGVAPEAPGARK